MGTIFSKENFYKHFELLEDFIQHPNYVKMEYESQNDIGLVKIRSGLNLGTIHPNILAACLRHEPIQLNKIESKRLIGGGYGDQNINEEAESEEVEAMDISSTTIETQRTHDEMKRNLISKTTETSEEAGRNIWDNYEFQNKMFDFSIDFPRRRLKWAEFNVTKCLLKKTKIFGSDNTNYFCMKSSSTGMCPADSGGPVMIQDRTKDLLYVFGIFTSVEKSTLTRHCTPGVISKVLLISSYLDWIKEQLGEEDKLCPMPRPKNIVKSIFDESDTFEYLLIIVCLLCFIPVILFVIHNRMSAKKMKSINS